MKLRKGYIYKFSYSGKNNHKDPNPLALILYAGKKEVHALNLNHLPNTLQDRVIDMIAMVSTRSLYSEHTWSLYHLWMKKNIPEVIELSYRTYKPDFISKQKVVSKGFFEVKNFLKNIKKKIGRKGVVEVKKVIKKSVNLAKKNQNIKLPTKSLFKSGEKITIPELNKRVDMHVKGLEKVYRQYKKKDKSKYTI